MFSCYDNLINNPIEFQNMKKLLFLSSIVLMTVWIIGVFMMKAATPVHFFLFVSLLLYIRSLMMPPANVQVGNSR